MYKIIGSDGRQYGPITAEQVRAWVAEGRANGQTMVQPEGATDWKRLAELPEFADLAGSNPPVTPPLTASVTPLASAADSVRPPAIGLIVVAALGFALSIFALLRGLAGAAFDFSTIPGMDPNLENFLRTFTGTVGIISAAIGIILSGIVFWGAMKMKALESYGLAMTASILALIPCLSPCCVLGLPIGIWALVILAKPEVKAAFH